MSERPSTLRPISLRSISTDEHRAYLASLPAASFLQTPGWARVKPEWRSESVGWFGPDGTQYGAALVLHRQLPKIGRTLAYLPEGPVIDWSDDRLSDWLDPLAAHLKRQGAFAIRIGPPVVVRRWTTAQVKEGIADPEVRLLSQVPPTERSAVGARVLSQLSELGWRHQGVEGGFAAGQPAFVFQVPLSHADGTPRTEDEVLKGMNQLWRRNIKKAAKSGVEVTRVATGTPQLTTELTAALAEFHALYVHTAERDHFTPRPASYFTAMAEAMAADDPDRFTLWLARHEGDLVAATIAIRVGEHAWYSYGASSTEKREVRGSNAVQWAMIRDALEHGARVYDLRGITETLDSDDPHVGLIQFKVGTGGEAVEYAGEWDLPLNRVLYKAFDLYMKRRG
ncbi:aminoacyltransferase [Nocardioides sp. BGMRC 2183]|nr:aminoacyltransferase [Nocardioides sp. BGMRC 2183]